MPFRPVGESNTVTGKFRSAGHFRPVEETEGKFRPVEDKQEPDYLTNIVESVKHVLPETSPAKYKEMNKAEIAENIAKAVGSPIGVPLAAGASAISGLKLKQALPTLFPSTEGVVEDPFSEMTIGEVLQKASAGASGALTLASTGDIQEAKKAIEGGKPFAESAVEAGGKFIKGTMGDPEEPEKPESPSVMKQIISRIPGTTGELIAEFVDPQMLPVIAVGGGLAKAGGKIVPKIVARPLIGKARKTLESKVKEAGFPEEVAKQMGEQFETALKEKGIPPEQIRSMQTELEKSDLRLDKEPIERPLEKLSKTEGELKESISQVEKTEAEYKAIAEEQGGGYGGIQQVGESGKTDLVNIHVPKADNTTISIPKNEFTAKEVTRRMKEKEIEFSNAEKTKKGEGIADEEAVKRYVDREEAKFVEESKKKDIEGARQFEEAKTESDALAELEKKWRIAPKGDKFLVKKTKEIKDRVKNFIDEKAPEAEKARLKSAVDTAQNPKSLKRAVTEVDKTIAKGETIKQRVKRTTGLEAKEEKIIMTERKALEEQIKNEAKGAKAGYKEGIKVTKERLIQNFREGKQQVGEVIEYIKDTLPKEAHERFLRGVYNIQKSLTPSKQQSLFARANRMKEKIDEARVKLETKHELKSIKEMRTPSKKMDVEYQKAYEDATSGLDFSKPTEKTLKRLKGLKDYIDKQGEPLGISKETVATLDRLTKKPLKDMSKPELQELRETLEHMRKMGELKRSLKYRYNERMREQALGKLVRSTRNIDPKVNKADRASARNKYAVKRLYTETIHTPRVADMLDGYKNYKGENVRRLRELNTAENDARISEEVRINDYLEEVKKVKEEWTLEEQEALEYHSLKEMKSLDQMEALKEAKGWKDEPPLTPEMRKVIDITKEHLGKKRSADVSAVYEEINNKPFRFVKDYVLPHKYVKETIISPTESLESAQYRRSKTEQGMTKERQKGVKKTPRTDFFNQVQEAMKEQEWYIHMEPKLANLKQLINTKEYFDAAGEMGYNFWRDVMDVTSSRGWASGSQSPLTPLLKTARLNLSKAVMGYKVSTIMMQPFAVFDAMAYMTTKYGPKAGAEVFKEFAKTWINPKYAKEMIGKSRALQQRGSAGEISLEDVFESAKTAGKFKRKFIETGMAPMKWADVKTAAGVERGILNILKKNGVKDPIAEADLIMNLTNGAGDVTFRPLVLSRGEGARALFTFQSFFLNRWGIMAHDIANSGFRGNWKDKINATMGLGIFSAGSVAEEMARRGLYEFMTGKESYDKRSLAEVISMTVPSQIPVLGQMVEGAMGGFGRGVNPPVMRTLEKLFRGGADIYKGKFLKGAMGGAEAALTLGKGIPGTAQGFDFAERLFGEEE